MGKVDLSSSRYIDKMPCVFLPYKKVWREHIINGSNCLHFQKLAKMELKIKVKMEWIVEDHVMPVVSATFR